jgi:hypothetical protein
MEGKMIGYVNLLLGVANLAIYSNGGEFLNLFVGLLCLTVGILNLSGAIK